MDLTSRAWYWSDVILYKSLFVTFYKTYMEILSSSTDSIKSTKFLFNNMEVWRTVNLTLMFWIFWYVNRNSYIFTSHETSYAIIQMFCRSPTKSRVSIRVWSVLAIKTELLQLGPLWCATMAKTGFLILLIGDNIMNVEQRR